MRIRLLLRLLLRLRLLLWLALTSLLPCSGAKHALLFGHGNAYYVGKYELDYT